MGCGIAKQISEWTSGLEHPSRARPGRQLTEEKREK
jgi:hypothetical protein